MENDDGNINLYDYEIPKKLYEFGDKEINHIEHRYIMPIKKILDIDVVIELVYDGYWKENGENGFNSWDCDFIITSTKCWKYKRRDCGCDCGESDCDDCDNETVHKLLFKKKIFKLKYYRELTIEDYETIKMNIIDIFRTLYFNKFIGIFMTTEKNIDDNVMFIRQICENPNVSNKCKTTYGDCCVCYESTNTTLECCKGNICISCWTKLPPKKDQLCLCPLCRNIINTKRTL
jgi:hypothetical protein